MELYGYHVDRESDLQHYGILGMKWGVRRWQGYDGSFNAAGIERYFGRTPGQGSVAAELGKKAVHSPKKYATSDHKKSNKVASSSEKKINDNKESKHEQFKLSDQQKKWIKIGAAAAVTALAVGGTIYLVKSGKLNSLISLGKNAAKTTEKSAISGFEEIAAGKAVFTEVKLPSYAQDYYDDMVRDCRAIYDKLPKKYESLSQLPTASKDYAKSYFDSSDAGTAKILVDGINHGADLATNNLRNQNCALCSLSVIARLKGFDVTAGEVSTSLPREVLESCVKDGKFLMSSTNSSKVLIDELASRGNGSYGIILVPWKTGGAHFLNYAVKNGAVEFLDGQMQKTWPAAELFKNAMVNQITAMDCTNLELTDYALKCFL